MERLQCERGVAHPGEAVVPVALAAGRLRQRRGRGGDRRARRHVGQPLDRERRALDGVAPPVVGDARLVQPVPPETDRRVDPPRCVVVVRRGRELLGPRQRAVRLVARLEDVPRTHAVAFDPEREIRHEPHRLTRTARVRRMPVAVHERPLGRRPAVVECRLADQLHLDAPTEAFDGAHEHVIRVVVGRRPGVGRDRVLVTRRPHRQRIANDEPAGRRLPGRHEHVRAGLVVLCGRMRDPERAEPEEAGLAVEQASERTRRLEAGNAEPVDRPVRCDQRGRVAVREKRVVRDRRERRRRGCALRLLGVGGGGHDAIHGPYQRPCPETSDSASAGPHEPGAYG